MLLGSWRLRWVRRVARMEVRTRTFLGLDRGYDGLGMQLEWK
jgi:hypothetical protein